MPAVHDLIENQLEKEPNSTVNPDEVVALGAAVQGAIIDGDPIDAILVDVTPYSLGIAIAAYRFSRLMTDVYKILIPRNTTIPVSKADIFHTLYPDQDAVNIKIYQGEHPVASKNTLLGDFMIDGLKAPTVGECAAVTVQFDFDVDGRLTVTARDRTTGQKSNIVVDAPIVHLNEKSLLQAQTRLEEMSYQEYDDEDDENEEERPTLSAAVAALIERTEKVVQRGDLDEQTLAKLTALLTHLASTKEQTDAIEEELVDLLYDLEDED